MQHPQQTIVRKNIRKKQRKQIPELKALLSHQKCDKNKVRQYGVFRTPQKFRFTNGWGEKKSGWIGGVMKGRKGKRRDPNEIFKGAPSTA